MRSRYSWLVIYLVVIITILIVCNINYADSSERGKLIPIVRVVKTGVENSALVYPSFEYSNMDEYSRSHLGISHQTIEYLRDDWKSEIPEKWDELGLLHDLSKNDEFGNTLYSKISFYDNFYLVTQEVRGIMRLLMVLE